MDQPPTGEDGGASIRYRNLSKIYNSCSFASLTTYPITYDEVSMDNNWLIAMNEESE